MGLTLKNVPELLLIIQGFELQLVERILFPLKVCEVEVVRLGSAWLSFPGAEAGGGQRSEDSAVAQPCHDRVHCWWQRVLVLRSRQSFFTSSTVSVLDLGALPALCLLLGGGLLSPGLRRSGLSQFHPPEHTSSLQRKVILLGPERSKCGERTKRAQIY